MLQPHERSMLHLLILRVRNGKRVTDVEEEIEMLLEAIVAQRANVQEDDYADRIRELRERIAA
jgi:hypothetical protein